ncbi:PREDICTED: LOW QUALITY PROTEIN: rho GTPase-activating protein 17-like [Gekko japonicus]|uniref:LOW QUALITY PROTEIN: rho GTPase-activating protein 17-like n=1 Tax=Gekko japonicus TaxID=146911 RepID=A0ABM1KEJ4_GEKJA|nr:PREDICTED: LOW QUALITY PROTEIN: rho GTPase-activating protein 17-like [Gekko japonicus]
MAAEEATEGSAQDILFSELMELDFNVSGAFVGQPAVNSNHLHTGNDYESGPAERKRPVSMAVMDADLVKDSFGVKVLDFPASTRRGGTVNRKHTAPAFQPPLPPTEAGTLSQAGAEQLPQGAGAEPGLWGAASAPLPGPAEPSQSQGAEDSSVSKSKDSTPSTTPPPTRNGRHGSAPQPHPQPASGTGQSSLGQPQINAGPSPHTLRRAVKKPAPAPPKPANPPPGQPGNQNASPAPPLPSVSPKPAARSPSPPSPGGALPAPATAQASAPRRYSSSLSPIHAPSHPPPQPPMQAATPPLQPKGASPGSSPTAAPGSEPGPEKHGAASPAPPPAAQEAPQATSPPQTGTLPRPRPVPKPRNRPTVPPPPHPPAPNLAAGDASLPGAPPTASRIVTESAPSVQEPPPRGLPAAEPSSTESAVLPGQSSHNHLVLDIDHDTESTAL